MVVPSADFQANHWSPWLTSFDIIWRYHQIVSIEDRANHCFKNECILKKLYNIHIAGYCNKIINKNTEA